MGPTQTPSYVLGGLCDTYYCLYIVSCRDVVQLKVFFLGFKEDLIYLFQNKFLFRILYFTTHVILLCYY